MSEAVADTKIWTQKEIAETIDRFVAGYRTAARSPILKNPGDYGLAYEDVWIPALDGVPLEAWLVPCEGSDKLVIANHPKNFNRYGFASHLDPWKQFGAIGGNDFEVDFVRDIKILHDAGYNVLTYDMRNHGHSGAANGGIPTAGIYEYRDVVGSIEYARTHPRLRDMAIGLFSRCFGANSTIAAMARMPDAFTGIKCLVACQPLSPRHFLERTIELLGLPDGTAAEIERQVSLAISFTLDQFSPVSRAEHVTVPTFIYQVRNDVMTRESDVQAIFDNVAAKKKRLHWIEGSTRRWDGYNYFSANPAPMLEWFDEYM
ncbi:hypothetical protein ASE00_01390 [Sphingomonas sp. Root710]|uniref:alpha/beta hydrolase family protein n=1 Tax=Sphingomonas sp. Root710 TaxID=1736594 RepID=UPI0006FC85E6|nr:hypothetical protein [Sphingomonas sp. Root710]KRB85479.1 hypothetical protein ASE00_01390 [Sphingomonas sp. Root710]